MHEMSPFVDEDDDAPRTRNDADCGIHAWSGALSVTQYKSRIVRCVGEKESVILRECNR